MNKLEQSYAQFLDARITLGEVLDWQYEKIKLRLANNCFLTVDFAVMLADGTIEFHECKGFMEDDAAVKLKVAADQHWWWNFVLVTARKKRDGGGFEITKM
jgi:hypothetical protein